jgi:hypothetical protein
VLEGQFIDQVGQAQVAVRCGAVRGDPQCQRQAAAQLGQPVGGSRVRGRPLGPGDPADQGHGVAGRQHVQGEALRAVAGGQAAERIAAGDYCKATGHPGKQRPDLPGAGSIIQHDEHSPAAEQAPVHRR